jgi:glyoxylase-like metal-dependent hydrolase (beta-lactamase superfamily II)
MRKPIHVSLLVVAACTAQGALAQDDDFASVEIIVHDVAENLYYLEGRGGNIGVLTGEDGVVLIDDQFAPLTEKIVAAVESVSDGEILYMINTHVHPDHTGGNENFGNLGVPILAHDNVRARLARGIRGGPPAPAAALPVITFSESTTLHLNGEEIRIVKVPNAHTDGDSVIHFVNADVLHTGDVYRTTGYPRIDADNGGTAAGTIEALDVIVSMSDSDTMILPGHGELVGRNDVQEFRDMVAQVYERVKPMVEEGMSLEQVVAAAPTEDLDARWGDPEGFLPGLYQAIRNELDAE